MSPGTPHLVFRLPYGKQMSGLAGHVARRCDIERWANLLVMEAEKGETDDEPFADVARGLATGNEHMLTKVASGESVREQYGGLKQIARAKKALERLKKLVEKS